MLKTVVFGISFLLVIAGLTGGFLLVEKIEKRNSMILQEMIMTENQKVTNETN